MLELYEKNPFRPSETTEKKFVKKARVDLKDAKRFLKKQTCLSNLPRPSYIPRLTSTLKEFLSMNEIHQADLLYLPKNRRFKYALTLVDVTMRYKAAVPLRTKTAKEVNRAL